MAEQAYEEVFDEASGDDIEILTDPETGEIIGTVDKTIPEGAEAGSENDQVLGSEQHDANLAEHIANMPNGATYLDTLATDLLDAIERDDRSRKKWKRRLADGIKIMGVSNERTTGAQFKGASRAVHPVLTEACVQFQARAIAELWPPSGPVKTVIIGESNEILEGQQKRTERYMNWQYTQDMVEAFDELDMLLFRLPLEGSCFKKQYFDAILMRTTTRFLPSGKVIVSDNATDLDSAPRVTVEINELPNTFKQYQRLGLYRKDINLPDPEPRTEDEEDEVERAIDDSEGIDREDDGSPSPEDISVDEYTHYETRTLLNLFGFEDEEDAIDDDGNPYRKKTGIALPYIVTINKDHRKILSIVRNWDEDDPHKRTLHDLTHYKYLPGLGFYGYGLLHTIGSLSEAASGALRALLDSAQFANMQGGFKTKGVKFNGKGEIIVAPGQWVDLDGSYEDIRKALIPLPYKEPSEALFKLLGALVEYAQRFASTTEAMVGDASNRGPVGTTVALIEQGSKVFSAIHKRCHNAQGREFKQVARLNSKHLPDEGVVFNFQDEETRVTREDFDRRIDITPVSDPNIHSQTQRIAQAQGVKQLAEGDKTGKMYDMYEVDRNLLEAMRVPDIDRFLKEPGKAPPSMSPLIENMAMVQGKPVKAYLHQDQVAHMIAHEQFVMGLPPDLQKMVMPAYLAHKAEHVALQYYIQTVSLTGVDLPPPPEFGGKDAEESMEKAVLPPEIENKIARLTVQAGKIVADVKAKQAKAEQDAAAAAEARAAAEEAQAEAEAEANTPQAKVETMTTINEDRRAEEKHQAEMRKTRAEQFDRARGAAEPKSDSMFQ